MKSYKQIINYQKRQRRDLEIDFPLVHLSINYRSYIGNNEKAMVKMLNKINEFRKQGLAPEYRLRMFFLSQEYYLKCYKQAPDRGHITYFDAVEKVYKSKHVSAPFNDELDEYPF